MAWLGKTDYVPFRTETAYSYFYTHIKPITPGNANPTEEQFYKDLDKMIATGKMDSFISGKDGSTKREKALNWLSEEEQ